MQPYTGTEISCILLVAVFSVSIVIGGVCALLAIDYILLGAGGAYDPASDLLIIAAVGLGIAAASFAAIRFINPVMHEPPENRK